MEARAGTLGPARLGPGRVAGLLVAAILVGIGGGVALHFLLAHPAPTPAIVTEHYGLDGQQS